MAIIIPLTSPFLPTVGALREQQKLLIRAPGWKFLRSDFILEFPACAACGSMVGSLQVHHIKCVRLYPELELVWDNLITLCGEHHFILGHGGNWLHWNKNIVEICRLMRSGIMIDRETIQFATESSEM